MAIDWWRSWHGAPTDAKWLVVAQRANVPPGVVSAIAWALLDHASQNEERGSIAGFDVETYAVWSGFSEEQVNAVIEAMRQKKNILDGDMFVNWPKRQPKREDPDGTQRQRNKRERDKEREREEMQGSADDALHCVTLRDEASPSSLLLSLSVGDRGVGEGEGNDAPANLDPDYALVCNAYHEHFGHTINESSRGWLKELLLLDTAQDIADALRIAAENGVPTWKYTGAILGNWRRDGKRDKRNGKHAQAPPTVCPKPDIGGFFDAV